MPTLSIEADPGEAIASLDSFITRIRSGTGDPNIRAGLVDASDIYLDAMRDRYIRASNGDGTWAELAESTIRRRSAGRRAVSSAARSSIRILYVTGRLFESFIPGDAEFFQTIDADGITSGSLVPYGAFHQGGTRSIPARPILVDPPQETIDQMNESMTASLMAAWMGSGN